MATQTVTPSAAPRTDFVAVARELAADFATRAAQHDADDSFVAENYAALKKAKLFSAPVPTELGGGGASYEDHCEIIRAIARVRVHRARVREALAPAPGARLA